MRCKPGDLVVIVRQRKAEHGGVPGPSFLGCFATVLHSGPVNESWVIDIPSKRELSWCGVWLAYDYQLKPIRDSDGVDEMIRIAGIPKEHA